MRNISNFQAKGSGIAFQNTNVTKYKGVNNVVSCGKTGPCDTDILFHSHFLLNYTFILS